MDESGAQRSPNDALERVRAARAGLRKPDAKVADLVLANLARVLD
jgi:hypothetical protein